MRIALVHYRLDLRGGTERVYYRTAEGLRDRGHDVHLFCSRITIPPPSGVAAHRVVCPSRPRTGRLLLFAFAAPRVVARYRCDIVMSFNRMIKQDLFRSGGGPHIAFLDKMARDGGWWLSLWHRLSPYHRCLLAIEKRQLGVQGSRKIVTVSEQGKREMMEYYRVPEEKIAVIYNGVDHSRFNPERRQVEGKKIRKELGIPLESPVVLFVGTGFRRKGLDRLLPLWSLPEFGGIYLLVAGNDAKLSYYRNRWGCGRIRFVGAQRQIQDYYAAADLFVLPSTQEAFGNAVLEALASGLPVVTVPEVGAAERLGGELREGLLMNRDDPEEIKQKVLRLLNKDRWPALSRAAREVSQSYSWENYFLELEEQFYQLARGGTGQAGSVQNKKGCDELQWSSKSKNCGNGGD